MVRRQFCESCSPELRCLACAVDESKSRRYVASLDDEEAATRPADREDTRRTRGERHAPTRRRPAT